MCHSYMRVAPHVIRWRDHRFWSVFISGYIMFIIFSKELSFQ